MIALANKLQTLLEEITGKAEFLAPLLIRLYLAPVFYMAGMMKYNNFEGTVAWFGNSLGMPLPGLMAFLATATELVGAVFLLFGFATRWISLPLMFTMLVAALTAHWSNGWLAIAGGGIFGTERTAGALTRLDRAERILREHGNYGWLTENGSFAVINNGIEFAATYLVMLLALLYLGGGKYLSVDHWIRVKFRGG
ncbi:MAG: HvfX family Cu-binding RiPP maturation protein [Pseudomonadales bacterium]